VDLGTLRFAADLFLQNGNTYSATGKIQLGLAPTGHETFTPLVDIVGTVSFTTGVADPTFQVNGVTNAEIDAVVQGTPAIPLWQATGTTTFDVQRLTTTGVGLGGNGHPLQVSSVNFTPDSLRFADPGGNTADAQVSLQGNITIDQLARLNVPVAGDAFVV